jgi:tetratricopeptide (TPR) repeat protein
VICRLVSFAIFSKLHDWQILFHSVERIFRSGAIYSDLGDTAKAIEFFEQGLIIACEIKDRKSEANALWSSALVYKQLGNWVKAISLADLALAI